MNTTTTNTNTAAPWALLDYNGVLGHQPLPADWQDLATAAHWTGTLTSFQDAFWKARDAYDRGTVTTAEFWATLKTPPHAVATATALDTAMWLRTDPHVLGLLADAVSRGVRLAMLSNAPTNVARAIEAAPWSGLFEHLLFSCDIGANKPEHPAYHHALTTLDTLHQPADVTFVDDRHDNVDAATRLGLRGHHYQGEPHTIHRAIHRVHPTRHRGDRR
ncbi:HAD-IA family hydrolase [Streptacidiphilus sp. EB103A]|uniref:HAD-IA family hydrolase n=1 Tax=Streptacidiphilus sp. EB103A TaxID=3156275 RepID=UPI003513352D